MNLQLLKNRKAIINDANFICLFGLGTLLQDCYKQFLLFLGKEPDYFCDNDMEKWGKEYFGKKCISPNELIEIKDNTVVIITVKKYEAIYSQLKSMGIKNILLISYERGYNNIKDIRTLQEYHSVFHDQTPFSSPIKGKWTLITGAARGIGRQIAIEVAKLGSNIVVHSRSNEHVKNLITECSQYNIQVISIGAELSNFDDVEKMLLQLDELVPQIDIIFNNAGISIPSTTDCWLISNEDYLTTFAINTVAPIRICNHLIPKMIKRGYGRVINVTSSIQKRPSEMAYACSKAALDKYVFDIAPSLNNTGVMISLVDPGWLRTDMGGEIAPEPVESVVPGILLGAIIDENVNGKWLTAQDYTNLTIEDAVTKAKFLLNN